MIFRHTVPWLLAISCVAVANAAGPVTFGSIPAAPAPGLSVDPQTGLISGLPTEVKGSGFDVTFSANDGSTTIELVTKLKINSSGGGGNSGVVGIKFKLNNGAEFDIATANIDADALSPAGMKSQRVGGAG